MSVDRRRFVVTSVCGFAALAGAARAQGLATLGRDADGYRTVTPGRAFDFPADHGPHPGYRIEWWYVTANLQGPDGTPYGLQWTLFRSALAPERGDAPSRGGGWGAPYLWLGHAAVTTPDAHYSAERFARGAVGQAGVDAAPFRAFIDEWSFEADGEDLREARLAAASDAFAYAVVLNAPRAPVLQGADGYSVKSPEGQASYYYSQPFFDLEGALTINGARIPVTGAAWMDREWSSRLLSDTQTGWDWFSLHLKSGAKVMAFRLRDTAADDFLAGTWIDADGTTAPLASDALRLTPLRTVRVAGRRFPTRWRVEIPARGLDVTVAALNDDSFMETSVPYWEGPVRIDGAGGGVGYLEMTGY
ncbi:MAG: lipocalin-like domain-containing protein [Pseudomonadota bacterium]